MYKVLLLNANSTRGYFHPLLLPVKEMKKKLISDLLLIFRCDSGIYFLEDEKNSAISVSLSIYFISGENIAL